jgi:catechol 2,3-dioxygenase-like lactoylglutathione lyase family enzyme
MRLDHIAYRVINRWDTANFFIEAFGYKVQEEFQPYGDDSVNCVALTPPEKLTSTMPFINIGCWGNFTGRSDGNWGDFHLAPEIFVSDGKPGSIVGEWVKNRDRLGGGIHHLAYQVNDVKAEMKKWKEKGWGKFLSEHPLTCPGIEQIFSEEIGITGGIIFEFIKRGSDRGFCKENVRALMDSTKEDTDDGEQTTGGLGL